MIQEPIFNAYIFGDVERTQMDRDGHLMLSGLLTEQAQEKLTASMEHIESLRAQEEKGHEPRRFSAEFDTYLESLIGHPQLLGLARTILGDDIRYDHCVALNRPSGQKGMSWHAHGYGEENFDLGFVRVFFYINGFGEDDGGLKVVPGSHLFKDRTIKGEDDADLYQKWVNGKTHPKTGEPLQIEALSAPPGTVIVMWTHALHGVNPRKPSSDTRWTVVYAYRNPGLPSNARWISEDFEQKVIPGAEGLLGLY
jgi:hypothetical protein